MTKFKKLIPLFAILSLVLCNKESISQSVIRNKDFKNNPFNKNNLNGNSAESTDNKEDLDSKNNVSPNNDLQLNNLQEGMADLIMGSKATSLMFDDREIDNIERAVESYKNKQVFTLDEDAEDKQDQNGNESEDNADKANNIVVKGQEDELNPNSYIYLASIIYSSPENWSIWLNNKKITSETNKSDKELFVKSIDRNQVSIQWNVSPTKLKVLVGSKAEDKFQTNANGLVEIKFSLRPNQTYVLGNDKVTEGKYNTGAVQNTNIPNANVNKTSISIEQNKIPENRNGMGFSKTATLPQKNSR